MARVGEEKELFRREATTGHDGFVVRRQIHDGHVRVAPAQTQPAATREENDFPRFQGVGKLAQGLEADGDVTGVAGQIRDDGDLPGARALGDEGGEVARARRMNDGGNVDAREASCEALRVVAGVRSGTVEAEGDHRHQAEPVQKPQVEKDGVEGVAQDGRLDDEGREALLALGAKEVQVKFRFRAAAYAIEEAKNCVRRVHETALSGPWWRPPTAPRPRIRRERGQR